MYKRPSFSPPCAEPRFCLGRRRTAEASWTFFAPARPSKSGPARASGGAPASGRREPGRPFSGAEEDKTANQDDDNDDEADKDPDGDGPNEDDADKSCDDEDPDAPDAVDDVGEDEAQRNEESKPKPSVINSSLC